MSRMLNTVRYLKPVQIYSRVYRRRPRIVGSGATPGTRTPARPWIPGITRESPQIGPNQFRFLNQEHRIETWNDSGIPKLWLYNLHYFESPAADLIHEWIVENPVGQGNGWEPYPISLRICNWIKWHISGNPLEKMALGSLALQTRYLAQRVEYHLLGNHLFANAKALVFAGAFFEGAAATEWLASGLRILVTQLPEQILADGGHFERSPMYHSLILEDVLDLINLGRAYPGLLPDLSEVAARMLGWLGNMVHPDGRIAFFNDAAFGVAPEPAALIRYADRLGIQSGQGPLGESGYIRLENARAVVFFDAAPIGPDYQPGHAHADTLSFELSIGGRRAIVNSGISTYENNAERLAQRSTPAHNTIRLDGEDSSEVWSAFRVARRARPLDVGTDRRFFAEAGHDGYKRLKDPAIHRRRLELHPDRLVVTDEIQARGEHAVELFFHLHPEAHPDIQMDGRLVKTIEPSAWHPEFNMAIPSRTVVGRWKGPCPVRFITTIPLALAASLTSQEHFAQ
jgi:uncharacterized heparinase superfamily protein